VILYHAQELIGKAVNHYSQFKAIDPIRESDNDDFTQEQFYVIIDKLIAKKSRISSLNTSKESQEASCY